MSFYTEHYEKTSSLFHEGKTLYKKRIYKPPISTIRLFNACYRHIIKFIHIINETLVMVTSFYLHFNICLKYITF